VPGRWHSHMVPGLFVSQGEAAGHTALPAGGQAVSFDLQAPKTGMQTPRRAGLEGGCLSRLAGGHTLACLGP
jgi:hypothetical protein